MAENHRNGWPESIGMGGRKLSESALESPGQIPKPKLEPWREVRLLTREKLTPVTNYFALIQIGAVPEDPEFVSTYYKGIPGDLEGTGSLSSLNAYLRDTGGLASQLADITTVVSVTARVDVFRNMVFAGTEKKIAAANAWANEVNSALARGEVDRAAMSMEEPILILASALEEADEETGTTLNWKLVEDLRAHAARFADGPDASGYILDTDGASWWGNNAEIYWVNKDLVNNGVRHTRYPTVLTLDLVTGDRPLANVTEW